jgi:hypothetical protein
VTVDEFWMKEGKNQPSWTVQMFHSSQAPGCIMTVPKQGYVTAVFDCGYGQGIQRWHFCHQFNHILSFH